MGVPMTYWLPHLSSLLYAIPCKSQAPRRKFTTVLWDRRVIWQSSKIMTQQRCKTNFARVANFGSAGEVRTSPIRGTSPSWRTSNIKLYIVYFIELRHLFYRSIPHISGLSRRSTLSSSVPASEVRQSASCTSRHSGRVRSTSSRRAMT